MVFRLVEENAKKRFELLYGYDPSPPPPKKAKGHGQGKPKAKRDAKPRTDGESGTTVAKAADGKAREGKGDKDDKRNRRAAKLQARAGPAHASALTCDGVSDAPLEGVADTPSSSATTASSTPSAASAHGSLDGAAKKDQPLSEPDEPSSALGSTPPTITTVANTISTPSEIQGQLPIQADLRSAKPSSRKEPAPAPTLRPTEIISTELPLVSLPPPSSEPAPASPTTEASVSVITAQITSTSLSGPSHPTDALSTPPTPQGQWFIRASQGHSIALASTAHLTPITHTPLPDDAYHITPSDRARAGLLVHGTSHSLLPTLLDSGLSRMGRQHVHLAPALEVTDNNRIAPRNGSTLLVYLDLDKMLRAGVEVYSSANGVVLTPGDEGGVVRKELWSKVERVRGGERRVVWTVEEGMKEENGLQ